MDYISNSTSSLGEPKGPPQACLFVANIPGPEVAEERVKDHFSQFGEVLKLKLVKDRSSRPYAFVQFSVSVGTGDVFMYAQVVYSRL